MGLMTKKRVRAHHKTHHINQYDWLPIEPWLVPSFHFTHVHGVARLFLVTEIVLSILIVFGVLALGVLQLFS